MASTPKNPRSEQRYRFRFCVFCGNDRAEFAGRCGICGKLRDEAIAAMAAYDCARADHVGCGYIVNGAFTETLGHAQEMAANEWPIHHGCGTLCREAGGNS